VVFENNAVVGHCAVWDISPLSSLLLLPLPSPLARTCRLSASMSQFNRLSIAPPSAALLLSFTSPAGEAGPSLVVAHSVVGAYTAGSVATLTAVVVWCETWETSLHTATNVGTCFVFPALLPSFSVPVDAFVRSLCL
jgi:hypothetical protein